MTQQNNAGAASPLPQGAAPEILPCEFRADLDSCQATEVRRCIHCGSHEGNPYSNACKGFDKAAYEARVAAVPALPQGAAEPATTQYIDGVPQFNPTAACDPTVTQCPRCNNPHHGCDRGSPASGVQQPVAWQPIETAPRTDPNEAAKVVLIGFEPDETGYSPTSREGFWSPPDNEWRFYGDPTWKGPPQPTHWMPLPPPPGAATPVQASPQQPEERPIYTGNDENKPGKRSSIFSPEALEQVIDEYLANYETLYDAGSYTPTDEERFRMKDAILGLLADESWDAEWGRHIAEQAQRLAASAVQGVALSDERIDEIWFKARAESLADPSSGTPTRLRFARALLAGGQTEPKGGA